MSLRYQLVLFCVSFKMMEQFTDIGVQEIIQGDQGIASWKRCC